jgi:DUF971 family protein
MSRDTFQQPPGVLPRPKAIRSPRGANRSEIDWHDGTVSLYPHHVLRGLCPCAQCQGHQGPIRWVSSVESASPLALEIRTLESVGNYALAVTWGDGHSGGIYSFAYLKRLAEFESASLAELREFRSVR